MRIGDELRGGVVCLALRRGGRFGSFLKARSGRFDI